jgi:hypothetical protein
MGSPFAGDQEKDMQANIGRTTLTRLPRRPIRFSTARGQSVSNSIAFATFLCAGFAISARS